MYETIWFKKLRFAKKNPKNSPTTYWSKIALRNEKKIFNNTLLVNDIFQPVYKAASVSLESFVRDCYENSGGGPELKTANGQE